MKQTFKKLARCCLALLALALAPRVLNLGPSVQAQDAPQPALIRRLGAIKAINTLNIVAAFGPKGKKDVTFHADDSIEKITLLGALDNPPVPGVPACDGASYRPEGSIDPPPASTDQSSAGTGVMAWPN